MPKNRNVNESPFTECLYVLELVRDDIDTTPDEEEIVKESHAIIQEYKDELPNHCLELNDSDGVRNNTVCVGETVGIDTINSEVLNEAIAQIEEDLIRDETVYDRQKLQKFVEVFS